MSPERVAGRPRAAEKPVTLLRQLGVMSAAALVVSNMVGTGIFSSTGFLAGDLGSPALVLLIWLVGAVCALAGAFCYSELGINFPSSGGEYVYLTRAFGPTWAFMTGWTSFFAGFSAPIAAAALAFADYLGYFFPGAKQANEQYVWGGIRAGGAQLAACLLIGTFTVLNCFGVQRVARVQNALTSLKLVVLGAFVLAGFLAGNGDWGHFTQPAVRTSTTPLLAQFAVSLFWVYVGYSGWNAATYVAEELKQPSRTLPLALAWGTLVVALLYLALNLLFIYATPLESMKGVVAIGSLAASHLFGPGVAGVFSGLMAASLMSTVNAMVTIGPRLYYAMAKNGAFFHVAGRVNARWHTPVTAIVCQGACAMIMTFVPFQNLVLYIGFMLNFFAVLSVASLFVFRRRPDWQKLRVVSFAFPLVPLTFIIVGVWMIVYGVTFRPVVSLISAATLVGGALVYRFVFRAAT